VKTGNFNLQFIKTAWAAAQWSNCSRRKVGAVVVRDGTIVIEACNGTPPGMTPCNEGGCPRCLSDAPQGQEYDSCLCIHAEQAAIALAARAGLKIEGAIMYCTLRPCLTCVKLCVQAGVTQIVYDKDIRFSSDIEEASNQLVKQTGITLAWLGEKMSDEMTTII
jgi:dCMP deaminase